MTSLLLGIMLVAAPIQDTYQPTGKRIEVKMSSGKSFQIVTDPKSSPETVAHILSLCDKKFYDRQRIHRVESWVTQWGSPASKDKDLASEAVVSGGSGKQLKFEISDVDFMRGVVGIASTGLQVGGDCQLFILKADTQRLWRSYAVVGKVGEDGMKVVDGIRKGDRIVTMRVVKS